MPGFDAVAFWSKFSKKEKMIAYIAVSAVLIAFFDGFVFQSILSRMKATDEEIRARQLQIRKDLRILAQKDIIKRQEQLYAAYSVEPKSQEEEISGVLKEIEMLSQQAKVTLIEVKPTDLKSEKVIKKYSIALNCEATMEQLANFMFLLENSTTLFTVDNYNIISKDKEKGILKCSLVISKVVIP